MRRPQAEDMTVTVDARPTSWENNQERRDGSSVQLTLETQQWIQEREDDTEMSISSTCNEKILYTQCNSQLYHHDGWAVKWGRKCNCSLTATRQIQLKELWFLKFSHILSPIISLYIHPDIAVVTIKKAPHQWSCNNFLWNQLLHNSLTVEHITK